MKISKRVREEAAMICAIAASNAGLGIGINPIPGSMSAAKWIGRNKDSAATRLAWEAFMATRRIFSEGYAEAESLLRTGWSPE